MRKINFSQAIKESMTQAMSIDKKVIIYGLGVGILVTFMVQQKVLKKSLEVKESLIRQQQRVH